VRRLVSPRRYAVVGTGSRAAMYIGLAANASMETGTAVRIADLSLPMGALGSR
jgi:hypothetical protein